MPDLNYRATSRLYVVAALPSNRSPMHGHGAGRSHTYYSLVGTARLRGVDPTAYLHAAIKAAVERPGLVSPP